MALPSDFVFFAVLEAGSPRPRGRQGWCLVKALTRPFLVFVFQQLLPPLGSGVATEGCLVYGYLLVGLLVSETEVRNDLCHHLNRGRCIFYRKWTGLLIFIQSFSNTCHQETPHGGPFSICAVHSDKCLRWPPNVKHSQSPAESTHLRLPHRNVMSSYTGLL